MSNGQQTIKQIQILDKLYQSGYRSNTIDATIDKLIAIERIRIGKEVESLAESLAEFEHRYGLSSKLFFEKFQSGQMGDDADMFEWSAIFQMWQDAHGRLENLAVGALV